jgi:hypothetical protein
MPLYPIISSHKDIVDSYVYQGVEALESSNHSEKLSFCEVHKGQNLKNNV